MKKRRSEGYDLLGGDYLSLERVFGQYHRHAGARRFTAEVERSLRVLDGVCGGIQRDAKGRGAERNGLAAGG